MICLDTNVVIAVLKQAPAPLLQRFLRALPEGGLALSSIVLFELHYGIANSARREENAERLGIFLQAPIEVLALESEDAEEAGALRAELKRAGTPIGPYDLLIAAQARRRGATLVTANRGEFARVPRLLTEDWTVA
ncbi:MAG: type II toxin-antitoxin system VapC family toxin [Tistlia sp.]|uniref:type II toxin-antitoxin system VapC family toxin n=1 Tax=Tistlia sp. TaxID=3057121 RepID=UPI0034A12498